MQLSKKKVKRMKQDLLEIIPEITAILDELSTILDMRLPKKDAEGNDVDSSDAMKTGFSMLKEFIDVLLVRQYDSIIKVIAVIYELDRDELEDKEMGELVDMVYETLSDEMLLRFFPRLRRLVPKTP